MSEVACPVPAGLLDPKLKALTCGQWVSINEANSATPYTDFCNVVGNACNSQGGLRPHAVMPNSMLSSSLTVPLLLPALHFRCHKCPMSAKRVWQ